MYQYDVRLPAPVGGLYDLSRPVLDRRRFLRLAGGIGVAATVLQAGIGVRPMAAELQAETGPVSRHTWLLDTPDALRPSAPPAPTMAEIEELIEFQESRTDQMTEAVTRWGSAQGVLPWDDLARETVKAVYGPGLFEARSLAHVSTAMHDARGAAHAAQAADEPPAPATLDDRIAPTGETVNESSTFPSAHAAVAGAASTVLGFLFPDASADQFARLAEEAALSRLWAGANYRSDIEAGLEIGRAVGQLAIEHALADGSDAEWDGSGWPTGDGVYVPTPPNFVETPLAPLAGSWATWVLPSGDALRPAPFPEYGSVTWEAEVQAVRDLTDQRTLEQERIIDFWLSKGPNGYYSDFAKGMIQRKNLGGLEAASILSMISVAMYDVLVAVWDAKYHYWIARPISIDPELNLYIPTPPYPSYPGGFGAISGAGATVLAHAFPEAEDELLHSAWEAAAQRGWSGIHYVLDDDVALLMGSQVGRMVAEAVHMGGV